MQIHSMRIFPAVEKGSVQYSTRWMCLATAALGGGRSQGRYDGWAFPCPFLHTLISENRYLPSKRQFRLAGQLNAHNRVKWMWSLLIPSSPALSDLTPFLLSDAFQIVSLKSEVVSSMVQGLFWGYSPLQNFSRFALSLPCSLPSSSFLMLFPSSPASLLPQLGDDGATKNGWGEGNPTQFQNKSWGLRKHRLLGWKQSLWNSLWLEWY